MSSHNPFIGLRSFNYEEREKYYGYKDIAMQLRKCVSEKNISMLTAPSGVGKSSFINATFIPVLEDFTPIDYPIHWNIKKMQLGDDPINELFNVLKLEPALKTNNDIDAADECFDEAINKLIISIALSQSNNSSDHTTLTQQILLIVDQFEELFTKIDTKRGKNFIDFLLRIKELSGIKILLVGRVDYLINLAAYNSLIEAINNSIVYLPSFPPEDLRYIIKRMARVGKLSFDDSLSNKLIGKLKELRSEASHDNISQDDSLGLLQYYLFQLWNNFSNETTTFSTDHYLKLGPFENIISRACDDVYYFGKPFPELSKSEGSLPTREEKHMIKFLFQYISKQDKYNPKKIVRNPQSLENINTLYNSIFRTGRRQLFQNESVENPPLKTDDWEKLVKIFGAIKKKDPNIVDQSDPVGILRYDKEGDIEVVHEAVFRQWKRCNKWISKEKMQLFGFFKEIIDNEEDNKEGVNKMFPYETQKEYFRKIAYFESEKWQDVYYSEYYEKNTPEESRKDREKWDENVGQAIKRLYRQKHFYAIKRADFYSLLFLKEFNKKNPGKIALTDDEIKHREFDKEFYYALSSKHEPATKELIKPSPEKTLAISDDFNRKQEKSDEEEDLKERIIDRWKTSGLDRIKLSEKLISGSSQTESHSYLYQFAAFGGNLVYLEALKDYAYHPKDKPVTHIKDPGICKAGKEPPALSVCVFGNNDIKTIEKVFDFVSEGNRNKVLTFKSFLRKKTIFHNAFSSYKEDYLTWLKNKLNEKSYSKLLNDYRDKYEWLPVFNICYPLPDKIKWSKFFTPEMLVHKDKYRMTVFFLCCTLKNINSMESVLDFAGKNSALLSKILTIEGKSSIENTCYFLAILRDSDNYIEAYSYLDSQKYDALNYLLNNKNSEVSELIKKQLNVVYEDGNTILHEADWVGFDVLKLMLEKGADPNIEGKYEFTKRKKFTPLDKAILRGDLNFVKLFFNKRNGIVVKQETKDKAAKKAFQEGRFEIFEYLKQQGAQYKVDFSFGWVYKEFEKLDNPFESIRTQIKDQTKFGNKKWSIMPIFDSKRWNNCNENEFDAILQKEGIVNFWGDIFFSNKPTFRGLRTTSLSFYPNVDLYELSVESPAINRVAYLTFILDRKKNSISQLDGTSPPLHQLNKELPIQLTNETVYDYLKFFCSAVHSGNNGAFKIIEKPEDIHWLENTEIGKVDQLIQLVLKSCKKPSKHIDEKGNPFWTSTALVNYGNALFLANFKIAVNGYVDMMNDQPIVSGLSVNTEVFENGLRTYQERKRKEDEKMEFNVPFMTSCFLNAASEGNLNAMKWLIDTDKVLNINSTGPFNSNGNGGKTALRIAVEKEYDEMVKWLLAQTKIADLKAGDGKTAYDIADENKNNELLSLFKEKIITIKNHFEFDGSKWAIVAITDKNTDWHTYKKGSFKKFSDSHDNFISWLRHLLPENPIFRGARYTTLPFYPNTILYEVKTSYRTENINQQYEEKLGYLTFLESRLETGNEYHSILNGTSPPLHKLNKELPIQLTNETVYDYLKFFCSAVHSGDNGAFKIIEKAEDIQWLEKNEKRKIDQLIQLTLKSCKKPSKHIDENGNPFWTCTALVNYGNALFLADFNITEKGYVDMVNDQAIVSGLSINTEVFENGLRTYKEIKPEQGEEIDFISFTDAAGEGLLPIMQWLFEQYKGLNVNMFTTRPENQESDEKEIYGKTALRLAVEKKDVEMVKWLLDIKVEDTRADDKKTAKDVAIENQIKDIITLFETHK